MTTISEGFQVSPQQRRLWLLQKAERAIPYRAQLVLSLEGELNSLRLRQAVEGVVQAHELLYTTFQFLPGVVIPLQVIEDEPLKNLEWRDELSLESLSADKQAQQLNALLDTSRTVPFDYEHGPLVRAVLVKRSSTSHWLVIELPSLYADDTTLDNLTYEIHAGYERLSQNVSREDEPIQHVSMTEWLYDLLSSESAQPGREYWQKQPNPTSLSNPLPLGTESGDPLPATLSQTLDPALVAAVASLATRYHIQPHIIYLATWQVLLWRLASESEIVVGTAFNGRADEELQTLLGHFTRTLPVAVPLQPQMRFDALLSGLDARWQDAMSWQDLFVWKAWRGMDEVEDPTPFFPFAFAVAVPPATHQGDTLYISEAQRYLYNDRHHLKLDYMPHPECTILRFGYDSGRFDVALVERIAEEYSTLLNAVVAAPTATLATYSIVGANERDLLITTFNQHNHAPFTPDCFHTRFEAQATRIPDTLAALYEDPDTGVLSTLTYGELNRRANQLAHALRERGIGRDAFVGLCLDRSVEAVIGVVGILKAGAAYLPLDADFPTERLAFMLEDTATPLIVTHSSIAPKLAPYGVTTFALDEESATLATYSEENPTNQSAPHDIAYAIYTSGSTGKPKGVMVEHASPLALLEGLLANVYVHRTRPTQRVSLNAPLIFDASMQQLVMLLEGCTLTIIPQVVRLDGKAYVEYLRRYPIDALDCTPSLLQVLVRAGLLEDPIAAPDLILAAGEAIEPWLWAHLQQARNTTTFNIYGPTEATVDASAYRIADGSATPTIGKPLVHYALYVLDNGGNPTPVGVAGELYIGGAGVTRGYLKRPGLTAERFVPDPFGQTPGARLYRTGDLAKWRADGNLDFMGRIDHQVKIRGYRIELGEIESTTMSHAAVQDVVVVVRGDREDKRLVAYLVLATPTTKPASLIREVRQHLQQHLPDYMVPSEIVVLPALPMTSSGKVDRNALPAPEAVLQEAPVDAPRTPLEEMVHAVWAKVLHNDQIGIHDNFFERGGHSLLAIQLVSGIRDVFGFELPLTTLFNAPTISALVQWVERQQREAQGVPLPPLEAAPRHEPLPLSYAQQRLWFLHQVEPTSTMYNMPGVLRMIGRLNVAALEKSIETIINRHETLRTTFAMGNDEQPVQNINPPTTWLLPVIDLQQIPAEERDAEVQRWLHDEVTHPFDLKNGPLLRVVLLRLAAEEHVLLFTLHHIVSDGWSTRVLITEITVLYTAYDQGEVPALPDLTVQYADFARWQREWLQGERLDKQVSYWKTRLEGAPAVLTLPPDRPRPEVQTFNGASQSVTFPPEMVTQLRTFSRTHNVTLFMPLMAAFTLLLHHYTNADDIVVGTDIANRTRPEVEPLIGFFINQLVLRTKVRDEATFADLLAQVRDVALEAYTHQDLPFDKLVEALNPERSRRYSPLFQAKIVLQNVPMPDLALPGLTLAPVEVATGTAKFDLLLNLWDTEDGLHCDFEYNTDLYHADTIERVAANYLLLLESVIAEPTATLRDLRTRLADADADATAKKAQALRDARLQKFEKIKPRQRS